MSAIIPTALFRDDRYIEQDERIDVLLFFGFFKNDFTFPAGKHLDEVGAVRKQRQREHTKHHNRAGNAARRICGRDYSLYGEGRTHHYERRKRTYLRYK